MAEEHFYKENLKLDYIGGIPTSRDGKVLSRYAIHIDSKQERPILASVRMELSPKLGESYPGIYIVDVNKLFFQVYNKNNLEELIKLTKNVISKDQLFNIARSLTYIFGTEEDITKTYKFLSSQEVIKVSDNLLNNQIIEFVRIKGTFADSKDTSLENQVVARYQLKRDTNYNIPNLGENISIKKGLHYNFIREQ